VRPSRSSSAIGMIVGIVFVGIGCFIVIPMFGPFGIFWTLIAGVSVAFHALNAFTDRGVATTEIDIEGTQILTPPRSTELAFDDRMRRIEQLRVEGLITEQEYQHKRRELLNEDW